MRTPELYKYNPGQCSSEEIEATFVAREAILETILDELRQRATCPANQHFLLIGPRGIGKTNLLIMIRTRVSKDKQLSAAYVALQTAEEEYSISSLRDLFSRILELLIEEESDSELGLASQSLASNRNDEDAAEIAINALKGFCKRFRKKVLLLVDNLDLVLDEQMTDDAQLGRLRDVLMNDSFLVLVGAAPTHFKEMSGYDRPFYNFFKSIELEDLSAEQMKQLLRKRAEWDENQTLLDRFKELKPRLNAVYHLTGGNPRLALMLYQFYTSTELPEVRAALQMLLDDITPYYKSRLEKLSPQQRKVMDAFARFGRPATPTELAQQSRLPVNQINSILNRLRELGFVSIARQKRRKTTLYIVSERVFRIWHQMRFSTASRRRLEFVIEFIRIWYTSKEWKREVDRLMGKYRDALSDKRIMEAERFGEHLEYFAEAAPKKEWKYDVEDGTVRMCIECGDQKRAEKYVEERIRQYSAEGNKNRLAESWLLMAYLCYLQNRKQDEVSALAKAVEFRAEFPDALASWGNALADLAEAKRGVEQERLFHEAFEKYEAAVKVKPDLHDALNNWGNGLANLAHTKSGAEQERLFREAFEKYEAALKVKPDMHEALNNWGLASARLAGTKSGAEQERLYHEAFAKYEAALKLKPDKHDALSNWGNALADLAETKSGAEQKRLFHEAFEKYGAAVKVKPDKHGALYNWGIALAHLAETQSGAEQERLYREAFEKYEAAVKVKPDKHEALNNWGYALTVLAGRKSGAEQERLFREAFEKYEAALKVKPDMHEALNNWGNVLCHLAGTKSGAEQERLYHEAFAKYEAALKLKPDKHDALSNWGNALSCLARTKNGAEQERLYHEAFAKYEAALKLKPDKHDALNNWAGSLRALAYMKSGGERAHLLNAASAKVKEAIELAKSQRLTTPMEFYSANYITILLNRCEFAVDADNLGHARELFMTVLDYLPHTNLESSRERLVRFFSVVLIERTALFCAGLFDAMRKRNMESELKLLEPFELAIEYWQKGKDEEVLDRLNPEVREIVEAIIEGKAKLGIEP